MINEKELAQAKLDAVNAIVASDTFIVIIGGKDKVKSIICSFTGVNFIDDAMDKLTDIYNGQVKEHNKLVDSAEKGLASIIKGLATAVYPIILSDHKRTGKSLQVLIDEAVKDFEGIGQKEKGGTLGPEDYLASKELKKQLQLLAFPA